MKNLLLIIFFIVGFTGIAAAQTFSAADFNSKIGKTGTLCDTIKSLKIVSDTLTLLNMGGVYPNQKYTVAIKGNKITLDWANMTGKPLCVTGVFELYKGRPEIEIAEPEKINVQKKEK